MKWKTLVSISLFALGSLHADTAKEKFEEYLDSAKQSIPGIALVSDTLECQGLTISRFRFDTEEKYTIVSPGKTIHATMDYTLDSDAQESFGIHHFLYGLHPYGAIDCLLDTSGLFDANGSLDISFDAPNEPGVYELRISYTDQGYTFSGAKDAWERDTPTGANTIGIVVVD